MDPLTNPAYLLFAAIAPLLIALVKQDGFSQQVNAIIAFVAYVVVGIAGALTSGTALSFDNLVPLITIATVVGSAAYNLLWNNIGVTSPTSVSLDHWLTATTSFIKAPPAAAA